MHIYTATSSLQNFMESCSFLLRISSLLLLWTASVNNTNNSNVCINVSLAEAAQICYVKTGHSVGPANTRCDKFWGTFAQPLRASIVSVISIRLYVCPSVRLPACNNAASTTQIHLKSDAGTFNENLSVKIRIWLKPGQNVGHILWRLE